MITVSERDCIIEKTPPFQDNGVFSTSPAISPTFWLTPSNIPDKFPVMPVINSSLSHSVMLSMMLYIKRYRLTK